MPNKKDYPKWFSIYGRPVSPAKPRKPEEFKEEKEFIYETTSNSDRYISIPQNSIEICVHVNCDDDDYSPDCIVSFYGLCKEIRNPTYDSEFKAYEEKMKRYEKDYKEYKDKLKEWKILYKKWRDEEKKEKEDIERVIYDKLKEKFEKENING